MDAVIKCLVLLWLCCLGLVLPQLAEACRKTPMENSKEVVEWILADISKDDELRGMGIKAIKLQESEGGTVHKVILQKSENAVTEIKFQQVKSNELCKIALKRLPSVRR